MTQIGLVLPKTEYPYSFRILDVAEARDYFKSLEGSMALDSAIFAWKDNTYEKVLQKLNRYVSQARESIGRAEPYGRERILELMSLSI